MTSIRRLKTQGTLAIPNRSYFRRCVLCDRKCYLTNVGFLKKNFVIVALNFKHGDVSCAAHSIDADFIVRDGPHASDQMNDSSIIDVNARRTFAFGYDGSWATLRARSPFHYTVGSELLETLVNDLFSLWVGRTG